MIVCLNNWRQEYTHIRSCMHTRVGRNRNKPNDPARKVENPKRHLSIDKRRQLYTFFNTSFRETITASVMPPIIPVLSIGKDESKWRRGGFIEPEGGAKKKAEESNQEFLHCTVTTIVARAASPVPPNSLCERFYVKIDK